MQMREKLWSAFVKKQKATVITPMMMSCLAVARNSS